MKIGSNAITHQPTSKAPTESSSSKEEGALIIIDAFHSEEAHGYAVEGAAREMGATGPVHRYNQLQVVDGRVTMPHVEALLELRESMTSEPLSKEKASGVLGKFLDDAVSGNLNLATNLLNKVTDEGFQNSAVNFSQGMDPITYLKVIKSPLGSKDLSDQQKQIYFHNLNSAVSPSGISQASPQQFDALLLDRIKETIKESPTIDAAREDWRAQVTEFESDNNSVVVAAGNSGQEMRQLAEMGNDLDGSEDVNIFAIDEVTAVAASATTESGGIVIGAPSSFGPEVDFIASGFYGEQYGSSFAAPKVANTLRAVHLALPEISSEEAEDVAKRELGQVGIVRDHEVGILDPKTASQLIARESQNTQSP